MFTIGNLIQNISHGQSGIPTRLIFKQLDNVYFQLFPNIKLLKVIEKNNGTLVYLLIPSQNDKNKYYDIVFWFDTTTKLNNNVKFKVYSNSPNFGYSYAYLFNQNGSLLFPEKYPSIMIKQPPKIRNPFQVTSFDKHVYAGFKFLFSQNLKALSIMNQSSGSIHVASFNEKMKEIKKKK